MTNGNDSSNPLEAIEIQRFTRKAKAASELNEALDYVSSNRQDYCKHLKYSKAPKSIFEQKGFKCGIEASHACCVTTSLLPEDVERQCHKDCHKCEWYEPYQEPAPTVPEPVDRLTQAKRYRDQLLEDLADINQEIKELTNQAEPAIVYQEPTCKYDEDKIKPEEATEEDIERYYDTLVKEGYVPYDLERIDLFYKSRPLENHQNLLAYTLRNAGLRYSPDYLMPNTIFKMEQHHLKALRTIIDTVESCKYDEDNTRLSHLKEQYDKDIAEIGGRLGKCKS